MDPSAYFRVGQIYDPDVEVGHIIAYRYYEVGEGEQWQPDVLNRPPNRIRVTRYEPAQDINEVQTYVLSGADEGGTIGEALTVPEPGAITALCTGGKSDSWYDDAKDVASAYIIRLSLNQSAFTRYDNRPIAIPGNSHPSPTRPVTRRRPPTS